MLKKLQSKLLALALLTALSSDAMSFTNNKAIQLNKKDSRTDLKKYFHDPGIPFEATTLFSIDQEMLIDVTKENCEQTLKPSLQKMMLYHYPNLEGITISIAILSESFVMIHLVADGQHLVFKGDVYLNLPCMKNVKQDLSLSFINKKLHFFSFWENAILSYRQKVDYCYKQIEEFAQTNGYEYYYHRDLDHLKIILNNQLLTIENYNENNANINWKANYGITIYSGSIEAPFDKLSELKIESEVTNEETIKQALAKFAKIDENEFELMNLIIEDSKVSVKIVPNLFLKTSLQKFDPKSFKELTKVLLI